MLIIPVILAQLTDLITFILIAPVVGIEMEINPIMREGYIQYGVELVILLKALCTLVIVLACLRVTKNRLRLGAVLLGTTIGFIGVTGNITSLLAN